MTRRSRFSSNEFQSLSDIFDSETRKHYEKKPEVLDKYQWLQWFSDIRNALVRVRRSKPFSQKKLAEQMNTDQGHISRLENTVNEKVQLETLRRFVEACGGRIAITIWDAQGEVVLNQADKMVERGELPPQKVRPDMKLDSLVEMVSRDDEFSARVAKKMAEMI